MSYIFGNQYSVVNLYFLKSICMYYNVGTPYITLLFCRLRDSLCKIRYIVIKASFCISTTWCVSLLVDQRVPEGICSQVLRLTLVDP